MAAKTLAQYLREHLSEIQVRALLKLYPAEPSTTYPEATVWDDLAYCLYSSRPGQLPKEEFQGGVYPAIEESEYGAVTKPLKSPPIRVEDL